VRAGRVTAVRPAPPEISEVPEGVALPPAMAALRGRLGALERVVVAFSGGADSALLAWAAHDVLGPGRAMAVTAVSPSLAPSELEDCRALAREWSLNYREVESMEALLPGYVANGRDRCWHCKDELMRRIGPVAEAFGRARVVLGVNLDDLGDHRPGQQAAAAAGAVFPFVDAGLTKAEVRQASRALGLRTWDKPAAACLASRLPYGTPVTLGALGAVAEAEEGLKALGFTSLRVRHYGQLARLEVPLAQLGLVLDQREAVVGAVRAAGYRYVTLDLEGLRSGNLNDGLRAGVVVTGPAPVARQPEVI
jgi:pyridinium-3,5-biscarboxylic acid mononucleotide sulfurtransferase